MIKRLRIGSYKMSFSIAKVERVEGVNSTLRDGNHILMWDFDDTTFEKVRDTLLAVQLKYELPRVYILETKEATNYIAYCFARVSFTKAISIVADTEGVDFQYFKFGVYREKFTLRVSAKARGRPRLVCILPGCIANQAGLDDLATWVSYETVKDELEQKVKGA